MNCTSVTPASSNCKRCSGFDCSANDITVEGEALKKIFEPFEQRGPDRTRRFGGLGLGLAISQAIVAAHEGQLTAESLGQGQGSTFRVRLSTMAKEAVSANAPQAPATE